MPCGSRVAFRLKRRQSYPREPFVAPVLPITALTAPDVRVALDELDAHDVLGHLVAELPLDPQPDRCTARPPAGSGHRSQPAAQHRSARTQGWFADGTRPPCRCSRSIARRST